MKNKKIKKLLSSLVVSTLIIGLAVPTVINGDEVNVVQEKNGVDTLVADTTTLGDAFPDPIFRTYVAEKVIGLTKGNYDESTVLSSEYISKITNFKTMALTDSEVTSVEGIQHFVNLTYINLTSSGITELNLKNLKKLYYLNFMGSNVESLYVEPESKATITNLRYDNSKIYSLDLTGYSILKELTGTKSTNGELGLVTYFYLTGTKGYASNEVRVWGPEGFISWDSTTSYYVLSSQTQYRLYKYYVNDLGVMSLARTDLIDLTEGGLMDQEGNLIVGATVDNVKDGKVILESGGVVITGNATYTFDGYTVVGETEITTEGNTTVANNARDNTSVIVGDVTTVIKVIPGSETIISLDDNGGELDLVEGSVITNADGSDTYLVNGGTIREDGTYTSSGTAITVPTDKLNDVITDVSEVTFPAGVIVDDGSTSITYPGTIIYDTDDNTLTYLPVDGLFNEDGTLKDGVTQEDIKNSQDFVTGLDDSVLKTELQSKVEDAQNQLNERNAEKAVDDLFETDGKIKDTVTQEDIDNAKDLVDNLNDGDKKTELQDKLEDAQNQLNERNAEKAVDDLFDKDGNIKDTVTQDDIDNAQNLVNELPEGQLKDELNDKLKEAQKQLDEKNFVVLEAFKVFTGTGTVYTKIDAPVEKFSSISVNGKELDASNYEVTSGSTIITLSEAYLKTLDNGTYDVDVEFTSGAVVSIELTVKVTLTHPSITPPPTNTPSTQTPIVTKPSTVTGSSTNSSSVNTGDVTDLAGLYTLLGLSALGFVMIIRKRKDA